MEGNLKSTGGANGKLLRDGIGPRHIARDGLSLISGLLCQPGRLATLDCHEFSEAFRAVHSGISSSSSMIIMMMIRDRGDNVNA
jgi:hypothetical protein